MSLVKLIQEHGHNAYAANNNTIAVEATYSDGTSEWELIPAELAAVRRWLGY